MLKLFARPETNVSAVPEKPETPARPMPMLALPVPNELDEYVQVAHSIGFNPAQLMSMRLQRVLHELHIPVFDYAEVSHYLRKMAKEAKQKCYWHPVCGDKALRDNAPFADRGWIAGGGTYSKLIPLHVLKRVISVQNAYAGPLAFYASEVRDQPDPFLMVLADLHTDPFIIAMWDEPGFTGVPEIV